MNSFEAVITNNSMSDESHSDNIFEKTAGDNEITEKSKDAIDSINPSQDEIWSAMLNSVDYYNQASGSIICKNPNLDSATLIEFETDIDSSKAYAHILNASIINTDSFEYSCDNTKDMEIYVCNNEEISIDNIAKSYYKESNSICTRANSGKTEIDNRYELDSDGIPCYYYRANPTNIPTASACLFPQEYAFGFLTDFSLWQINETETYMGRNCVVISGVTAKDYGRKLGVEKFIFYVDIKTGTLLKYIGYTNSGEISDYVIAKDINFDNAENSVSINVTDLSEYVCIN
jgi:hypothetical protein